MRNRAVCLIRDCIDVYRLSVQLVADCGIVWGYIAKRYRKMRVGSVVRYYDRQPPSLCILGEYLYVWTVESLYLIGLCQLVSWCGMLVQFWNSNMFLIGIPLEYWEEMVRSKYQLETITAYTIQLLKMMVLLGVLVEVVDISRLGCTVKRFRKKFTRCVQNGICSEDCC